MVEYKIMILKAALEEKENLKQSPAKETADKLLELISKDPYQSPPACERLCGDLEGLYLRRIDSRHKLVYRVLEKEKAVIIISM